MNPTLDFPKPVTVLAPELGVSTQTLRKYAAIGLSDFTEQGIAAFRENHPKLNSRRRPVESKCPRHILAPSTHAVWYLAELSRDLKSFPDWGILWDDEKKKRASQERTKRDWPKVTREERDRINARIRAFRATDEAKARQRAYRRRRIEENPMMKVEGALRARLVKFIRGNNKSGIRNLLGCSWLQFRRHLESKFTKGITWENYGTHWHIDHIIPCAAFDHSNLAQLRQCWHFSNLRPLSAKKNLAKGASVESPQLALLLPM